MLFYVQQPEDADLASPGCLDKFVVSVGDCLASGNMHCQLLLHAFPSELLTFAAGC